MYFQKSSDVLRRNPFVSPPPIPLFVEHPSSTIIMTSLPYPSSLLQSFIHFIGLDKANSHQFTQEEPLKYSGSTVTLPSRLVAKCHPLEEQMTEEVNSYFLQHWPFENEKARKKFVAAGFSRVTCMYFPMAKDESLHFACRLLTLLFLIDGL